MKLGMPQNESISSCSENFCTILEVAKRSRLLISALQFSQYRQFCLHIFHRIIESKENQGKISKSVKYYTERKLSY